MKSSYSGGASCVDVTFDGDRVYVRNTRAPERGAHTFTADEWHAFLLGVKDGEFDLPQEEWSRS